MSTRTPDPIIALAITKAGGPTKLANALGIGRSAPLHWTRVPEARVRQVHELTGIPLSTLRPDLYCKRRSRGKRRAA